MKIYNHTYPESFDAEGVRAAELENVRGLDVVKAYGPGVITIHFGGPRGDSADPYTGYVEPNTSSSWVPSAIILKEGKTRTLRLPLSTPDELWQVGEVVVMNDSTFAFQHEGGPFFVYVADAYVGAP